MSYLTSADHTTHYFDSERLDAAQLDGRACVICGTEDGPMKPVATVPGHGQVFACTGETPDLPPTVRERAEKAGRDAVAAFEQEYRAEMKAHKHERANRGTTPARWLADDPCPAWCVGGTDHTDGNDPADRIHFSDTTGVELVTMEPVVMGFPERWAPPAFQISMDRRYREREPRIALGVGDETFAFATLDEAEHIARAMLALVSQARGGWSPIVVPFDEHGRCDAAECAACRPSVEGSEESA